MNQIAYMKILLIEDEAFTVRALQRTLSTSMKGAEVQSASDLASGLEQIRQKDFDVVVLDLNLPDSRGTDTVIRLNKAFPEMPIVVLSGIDNPETVYDALQKGAQEYLTKDTSLKDLLPGAINHAIQRKRLDLALQQSTKQWQTLFESANDGILIADAETKRFVNCNETICRILGYTREELLKLGVADVHPKEALPHVIEVFEKQITDEEVLGRDLPMLRKDGTVFWSNINSAKLHQEGKILLMGIIRDVTEQKKVRDSLIVSEQRYRLLFENMLNGFALHEVVVDEQGKPVDYVFLEVNAAFERLTGLKRENLIGRKVTEALPGIEKDPFNWIGRYGKVALEGEEIRFEQYSEELGKWFSIIAFRPRANQFAVVFDDITERKLSDAKLKETTLGLKLALRASSIGPWDWNLITNEVHFSPEWKKQIGYKDDEISNSYKEWESRLHPDDHDEILNLLKDFLDGKSQEYAVEFRMRHKDGSYRWIFTRADVLRDEAGKNIRILGCHVDITQRKQTTQKYETLFKASRDAIMTLAPPSWKFTTGNPAAVELFHAKSEEEFISKGPGDLSPEYQPDGQLSAKLAKAAITKAMKNGLYFFEWTHQTLSGDPFPATVLLIRVELEGKKLLQATVRDISHQKQAEELLERTAKFPSENPNPVLRVTANGTVIYSNESGKGLLKHWATKPGKTVPENWCDRVKEVLESRSAGVYEEQCGEKVYSLGLTPVADQGYVNFYGADITERVILEAKLRQSQKLESIGTLASGVAHEINNPINGIMNYAQLILDQSASEGTITEFATEIGKESRRVAEIVRNLLGFSRPSSQEQGIARVCDIVNDTMALIKNVLLHDHVILEIDIPEDLPLLKCRDQQIQQVIMNLVTNARDALNEKYPDHDEKKIIRITAAMINKKENKEWVRTTVEDYGTGIPRNGRDHIFDPFFTSKRPDKGTGLGLFISYNIVKEHGGEMSVDSKPGKYTRIHIDLPVAQE